jgi:GT2 family glycosyltransferase
MRGTLSARTPSAAVVVCAYSDARWPALARAVGSLRIQSEPAAEVILVVDHNPVLLQRAAASFAGLRVVASEGSPGLSGARNTGVQAATAEIVAFLDDDAVAAPDWLHELLVEFAAPEVLGVGGVVSPRWPAGQRAGWLPEEFYWTVGCSYRGLPAHGSALRNPIGANMAFRREALLQVGGFREELGRVGGFPAGCEETELAIRLRQAQPRGRIVHSSRARVEHEVADDRVHLPYFVSRCFAEGLSKAAVESHVGRDMALQSERRYVVRTLPAGVARGLGEACRGVPGGLARAGAIGLGLTVTVCGYVAGRSRQTARAVAA